MASNGKTKDKMVRKKTYLTTALAFMHADSTDPLTYTVVTFSLV
jgi:hypothetical protein